MNDGTAIVFFMLFKDLAKGYSSTPPEVIMDLLRVTVGASMVGLFFGIVVSYWLHKIIRDSVLSINITIVAAYICFYVS